MLWEYQNSDLHLAYWNHDTVEIVNYTKKIVVKFNYVLQIVATLFLLRDTKQYINFLGWTD